MTTSLHEQLQRLATPQTLALVDTKYKASLLFHPKEAATKHRHTIYDLGVDGLRELIAIQPAFQQFELTLFDEATMHMERAVEQSDVNKLLDRNIRKFLYHLSPYFLLRPAHQCIEWLLRRFHAHEFNRADLLALALPYHETNAFVRLLKTLRIRKSDGDWLWLRRIQKTGLPLPKSVIVNRAASHHAFLAFVCDSTMRAVSEFGAIREHQLQTQINFYTTVVVGALQTTGAVEEWHVTTVLPSLLKALAATAPDLMAAAYIVTAQLVGRTQITEKLCRTLVKRVAGVRAERLQRAALLLLIWIYETQAAAQELGDTVSLLKLMRSDWLTPLLGTIVAEDHVEVQCLLTVLIREAVRGIQSQVDDDQEGAEKDAQDYKDFLQRMLNDVQFPERTAQHVIRCSLRAYLAPPGEKEMSPPPPPTTTVAQDEILDLVKDDDDDNLCKWYSDYLHKLERQYPTAFDATVKEAIGSQDATTSPDFAIALKTALSYRLKSLDVNASDMYASLYHHSATMRQYAVRQLLAMLPLYRQSPHNHQLLRECLADRIVDDSALVVGEVLQLPTADFVDLLGCERFVNALFALLHKALPRPISSVEKEHEDAIVHWLPVQKRVVKHLTASLVLEAYDVNLILLELMPLLFPPSGESVQEHRRQRHDCLVLILESPLVKKLPFLGQLQVRQFGDSCAVFKRHFLRVLVQSSDTPLPLALLRSVQSHGPEKLFGWQSAAPLSHFMLLLIGCIKQLLSSAESSELFALVQRHSQSFQIERQLVERLQRTTSISMELYLDFVLKLMRQTRFDHLLQWDAQQPNDDLRCFLGIVGEIAEQACAHMHDNDVQRDWTCILPALFKCALESPTALIAFLGNFYVHAELRDLPNYAQLRIVAFRIMNALLRDKGTGGKLAATDVLKICVALSDEAELVRMQALETLRVVHTCAAVESGAVDMMAFVAALLERSNEIVMDQEQYALVLYTIVSGEAQRQLKRLASSQAPAVGAKVLRCMLQLLGDDNALNDGGGALVAELLGGLKHINDAPLLAALLPLGIRTLGKATAGAGTEEGDGAVRILHAPYSHILAYICERFDASTIATVCVNHPDAWRLIDQIFSACYDVLVVDEGKLKPLPCVFLDALDEAAFAQLPAAHRARFVTLIVRTTAIADNDTIFLAANKLIKKCKLDCRPYVALLQAMYKTNEIHTAASEARIPKRRSAETAPRLHLSASVPAWREGIALLELLENKRHLENAESLVPPLFELLMACLEIEVQTTVEYTKQLTLSVLLHSCQQAQADGVQLATALPPSTFRIEQIVQCMRATSNPQTHLNALLLLTHCATLFPRQVLHNVVDIFTFVGSSVVRHDDAFSFHLINNIIESVIPIVVAQGGRQLKSSAAVVDVGNVNPAVIPVLKVFADIMLDVPEHRRLPLYVKLMTTLGPEQYLWPFLCIVFEAHIIDDEKQQLLQRKAAAVERQPIAAAAAAAAANKMARRIEISLELTTSFEPTTAFETCAQLLHYLHCLPLPKKVAEKANVKRPTAQSDHTEQTLFDVESRSPRQFRHYKYVIMQFLSSVTCAPPLLRKIAALPPDDQTLRSLYQNLIIKTLTYVPVVNGAIEAASSAGDSLHHKYWRVILHHLHELLDNAMSLLSPDMFVIVVGGLMQHKLASVRKKVIELLNGKLQQRDDPAFIAACGTAANLDNLVQSLSAIVASILDPVRLEVVPTKPSSTTVPFDQVLQQTALISVKLLSQLFALKHIEQFKAMLALLTRIAKRRMVIPRILLGTVVLALIEVASNLRVHSLAQLPQFMPQLLQLLETEAQAARQRQATDNVCLAIITGVQKLFDVLPLFLGPYLVDIFTALCVISTRIQALPPSGITEQQRANATLHKIDSMWTRIAVTLPLRVVIPSCERAYEKLLGARDYAEIGLLMRLLPAAIKAASNADLAAVQGQLTDFFLRALELRLTASESAGDCDRELVATTEAIVIEAFVAWVLKLSESAFRPLYVRLYDWALKRPQTSVGAEKNASSLPAKKEPVLTYFLLTHRISEELKSLFVLFARDFFEDAARLLDENNAMKHQLAPDEETIHIELLRAILNSLHSVFLHGGKGFLSELRFEMVLQPLVDQLENRLVHEHEPLQQALTECVAQLSVAASSDVLWKQLNYQVLLKTRCHVTEVQIISFNCCVEIARKLGEDFTALLPDTVPFIAELFEDENPRVEKNTRRAVQELEVLVGDSLEKYL